jgi:hypothetical protein
MVVIAKTPAEHKRPLSLFKRICRYSKLRPGATQDLSKLRWFAPLTPPALATLISTERQPPRQRAYLKIRLQPTIPAIRCASSHSCFKPNSPIHFSK